MIGNFREDRSRGFLSSIPKTKTKREAGAPGLNRLPREHPGGGDDADNQPHKYPEDEDLQVEVLLNGKDTTALCSTI